MHFFLFKEDDIKNPNVHAIFLKILIDIKKTITLVSNEDDI